MAGVRSGGEEWGGDQGGESAGQVGQGTTRTPARWQRPAAVEGQPTGCRPLTVSSLNTHITSPSHNQWTHSPLAVPHSPVACTAPAKWTMKHNSQGHGRHCCGAGSLQAQCGHGACGGGLQADAHTDVMQMRIEEDKQTSARVRRYCMTPWVLRLNDLTPQLRALLPPTDTRLRPDVRALEAGIYDQARSQHLLTLQHALLWFRLGDGPEPSSIVCWMGCIGSFARCSQLYLM